MPQLVETIKFTITCLYKMPIRRPAPLDRLKQKSSVDAPFYQRFDVLYIKDKFRKLDSKVATQLGKMISHRRQLLFYRLSHAGSLETTKVEPKFVMAAPLAAQSSSTAKNDSGPEAVAISEMPRSQAASHQHTVHTETTTLRLNAPQVEARAALYAPSVAESKSSMASSYAGKNLRVEVPPRPKGKDGNELDSFECLYCMVIQYIQTDHAWK